MVQDGSEIKSLFVVLVNDRRAFLHRRSQPDVPADRASVTDSRVSAENCRVRVDRNIIPEIRMPFAALDRKAVFIILEALGTDRNASPLNVPKKIIRAFTQNPDHRILQLNNEKN